jgi:thioesterase domain-containing protein
MSADAKTSVSRENLSYVHDVFRALQRAYADYEAPAYESEVELFVPTSHESSRVDFWRGRTGSVVITATNGDHYSMLSPPRVQSIASIINDRLRRIIAARKDRP